MFGEDESIALSVSLTSENSSEKDNTSSVVSSKKGHRHPC